MSGNECWCEYMDIGVGEQRVTDNPDCPEHHSQQEAEVLGQDDLVRLAGAWVTVERLLAKGGEDPFGLENHATNLVNLIRTVMRSEVVKYTGVLTVPKVIEVDHPAGRPDFPECTCRKGPGTLQVWTAHRDAAGLVDPDKPMRCRFCGRPRPCELCRSEPGHVPTCPTRTPSVASRGQAYDVGAVDPMDTVSWKSVVSEHDGRSVTFEGPHRPDGVVHCGVCGTAKSCHDRCPKVCGNCGFHWDLDADRCSTCCPGCGSTEGVHKDGSCVL